MAMINEFNALQAIEKGILTDAKERLQREIVKKLTDNFKSHAEEVVREELERLVIGSVQTMEDAIKLQRHLKVWVEWNGEQKQLERR